MDDPEIRYIPIDQIRSGPIRHESLPDELLERIRAVHKLIGPYVGSNLEQFELSFMRDSHPEHEVSIWSRIAIAWHTYHKNFTNLKRLPEEAEKDLIRALLTISMGADEHADLGVDIRTDARLRECYDNSGDAS